MLAPGTPKPQVQILQDAFRKTLRAPELHREFKKLSGLDASPLMPEEQNKAIRELPRDPTWSSFLKSSRGPIRCRRGEANNKDLWSVARADD